MIKEHVSQVFFRYFGPLCKYFSNIFLDCSMWRFVADDHCDLHLNTIECNFDGGDCLNSPYAHCHNRYWINDNECDLPNNITECDYDGGGNESFESYQHGRSGLLIHFVMIH